MASSNFVEECICLVPETTATSLNGAGGQREGSSDFVPRKAEQKERKHLSHENTVELLNKPALKSPASRFLR